MSEPRLEDLSESARAIVMLQVRLLSTGFSGILHLECVGGGVKWMNVTRRYLPKDLVDAAES